MTAEDIRSAVTLASASWPPLPPGPVDPNLWDVFWLGKTFHTQFGIALPTAWPAKVTGVDAVECVEKNFIQKLSGRMMVRVTPVAEVSDGLAALVPHLRSILAFSDEQNLVVSMYSWHGCIHMAKTLRSVDVLSRQYTPEMRQYGYDHIQREWTREDALGNTWVRYGVSLARPFEMGRKREDFSTMVHENWVPEDSPYWEE